MSYKNWFKNHYQKHRKIVEKLESLDFSDDEIIEYFRFENMVEQEPDFCPLYSKNEKCHNIENLNCYLCGCPYFRFNDEGIFSKDNKLIKSICSIDAKDSEFVEHKDIVHLSCSFCLIPHKESFIKKQFSKDWSGIMKNTEIKNEE